MIAARQGLFTSAGAQFAFTRLAVGFPVVILLRMVVKVVVKVAVKATVSCVPALRRNCCDHEDEYECWLKKPENVQKVADGSLSYSKAKKDDDSAASPADDFRPSAPYNYNTAVRLASYTAVGWAVAEPCFDIFALLGV